MTLGRWVSGSRRLDETHCFYLRGSGSPRSLLTHHTVKWDITDPNDTVSSWHANSRSVKSKKFATLYGTRSFMTSCHWSLSAASISAPHTHTHTHTHTHYLQELTWNTGLLEKLIVVHTNWNSIPHGPKRLTSCSQEPRDIKDMQSTSNRHLKCYFIRTPCRKLEFEGKNNGNKAILF